MFMRRKVISTYFTVQCRHLYCLRDVLWIMKSGGLKINCHNQVLGHKVKVNIKIVHKYMNLGNANMN